MPDLRSGAGTGWVLGDSVGDADGFAVWKKAGSDLAFQAIILCAVTLSVDIFTDCLVASVRVSV